MAVRHVSEQEIWAAGGDPVGLLWHTMDGGTTWEALTTTQADAALLTSFAPLSDDTIYATGVLRTQLSVGLKMQVAE